MSAITLTGIEWAGIIGLITILIGVLGYLLAREFKNKDQIRQDLKNLDERLITSLNKMAEATGQLSQAIMELRLFVVGNYVNTEQHESDIEGVKELVSEYARRFERELDRHESTCPGKMK